jgi:hypothetical protein
MYNQPPHSGKPTLEYLMLAEAMHLEKQRQANLASSEVRSTYHQHPEPPPSFAAQINEKIDRIRQEYLPQFLEPEQCERIWVVLGVAAAGILSTSFGFYIGHLYKTH